MKNIFKKGLTGMQVFTLVWFGQFISIMGTSMTRFALMIWAYERVGTATTTALLGFSSFLPYIVLSPIAGVIVDRNDRKKIMIFSDLFSGMVSIMILILFIAGKLEVWHLFLSEGLLGAFEAFQLPAYSSAITMLIPKDKYTRASGMRSFSNYASQVLAPILGGFLVITIGIKGVLMIDVITFLIATTALITVKIPNPEVSKEAGGSIWKEFKFGVNYLYTRKGLFKLMMIFFGMNFLAAMTYFGILPAMILSRTGNNKMVLASVQGALGIGGVVGSLIVSVMKAPKRKVLTMLMAAACSYLLGDIFLGIGSTAVVWYVAAFFSSFVLPLVAGPQNALWQEKVEPQLQGRIFAIRSMLQIGSMPLGYLAGGFLADKIFEPAMRVGGNLSSLFGPLFGTGKGSGMALMFTINGILGVIICVGGYFIKDVRHLETTIKDHDMIA